MALPLRKITPIRANQHTPGRGLDRLTHPLVARRSYPPPTPIAALQRGVGAGAGAVPLAAAGAPSVNSCRRREQAWGYLWRIPVNTRKGAV